ncbi:D-alanyl-D-alanine carboxypeptidase family protein [Vibrio barjaei]|uniref:D-alanyl-D-alanine carboxypeptidase family protein n=1 Tax=Vibrio barjaei TaxID=1676683 RepID=UPI0022839C97|nr:D-alanyl-D-alanine carboxypeptidase family protein [Vibrio barjaei]MCY9873814.1 D-alanyl-D-alanine carboxypeptidase [Vibrio barjaei]
MKRLFILPLLASSFSYAGPAVVPNPPAVTAKGHILVDFHSGEIISGNNIHTQLNPASLTKILTSYVVGQEIQRGNVAMDDMVKISRNAWAKRFPDSSKMFIEVGTYVSVEDLYRGLTIQSGNDAATALAEHAAGSVGSFVDLMNAWSKEIGMENSHFSNPHGLHDPYLYTTPYDMSLLARALIKDIPEVFKFYSEKKFEYNGITQYNRNGLLWDKSLNVDGMKTGYTKKAGYSLVSTATEGKMRLVSVVMGAKSATTRKSESKRLLSYGFRFYDTLKVSSIDKHLVDQKIYHAKSDTSKLGTKDDVYMTIPKGHKDKIETLITINEDVKAPFNKGDVLGTVKFFLDGDLKTTKQLIALEDIEEASIMGKAYDYVTRLLDDVKNQ